MSTIKTILCVMMVCSSSYVLAQSKGEMPFTSTSPEAKKLLRQAWVAYGDVKFDEAEQFVKQALEKDPQFAMAYASLYTDDDVQRDKNLEKALRYPLSVDEKFYLDGMSASIRNKPTLDYFEPLLKKYPKDYYLHLWIMFNYGDDKRSKEIGETIVKNNPKFAPAHNMLGYSYMRLNEMKKAEASFDKYIALRPDLANVYDSKGDYMMRMGNIKEAQALYEKAASMGMTVSKVRAERASLRLKYPNPTEKDIQEIKTSIRATSAEIVKGDMDAFFSHYANQSIEIFGNQMVNVGISNLRHRLEAVIKNGSYTNAEIKIISIEGIGPMALAWGTSTSGFKSVSSGETTENTRNVIFLFRKQQDGQWKILADHFYNLDAVDSKGEEPKVREVLAKYSTYIKPGEVRTKEHNDKRTALFSDQAIEIYPSQQSNIGIANLKTRLNQYIGWKCETNSLGTIGVEVLGRRAVAWGAHVLNYYQSGKDELTRFRLPWAMILTKESDDQWRILAYHWYSE